MAGVVVTGVSTGIGRGVTEVLVERGIHVYGSVRTAPDARRLVETFGDQVTPLLFDVTDAPAVRAAAEMVRARQDGRTLTGLVNNAGIAVPGPLLAMDPAEFRHQLEVNLVGPLTVTQVFAPLLGVDAGLAAGPPGRIVNIGSALGRFAMPFVGAYVTSKFGIEGFSVSLRRELVLYGIDVIVVAPGAVATPIWDKADAVDENRFVSSAYAPALRRFKRAMLREGRGGLAPRDIGAVVWRALTVAKPRVHYAVSRRGVLDRLMPRLVPSRVLDRLIARRLGLTSVPTRR